MNLIAAVDRQNGIGLNGQLLVSIPLDQKEFRAQTMGGTIVMGRKTLETFPQGQPLVGRTNVILSRNMSYSKRGAVVKHSLEETLDYLKTVPTDRIYIVGGESIYNQFLPYCDTAYLTMIDYTYRADAHFPTLSPQEWEMTQETDEETYFDLVYRFTIWQRKGPAKSII